jgi:hypothetical protein
MTNLRMTAKGAARPLVWCAPFAIALASGCASIADKPMLEPDKVSAVHHATFITASRLQDLHLLNIDEAPRLRGQLQRMLSYDVLALSDLLHHYKLSADERVRVQHFLTLIAVQNEKFPISEWNSDAELMVILNAAIADNPKYAEQVRARNWSKPMWQR